MPLFRQSNISVVGFTVLLNGVHCVVGLTDDVLNAGVVIVLDHRDTDGHADGQVLAVALKALVEPADDILCNAGRVVDLGVAYACDELVAAVTSGKSELVHGALDGARHELQYLVAGRVAVLIVIVLEVVNVDEQNCHLALTGFGQRDLVVDLALDGLAVVKLGQRVEACAGGQLLLALLSAVDIQHDSDDLLGIALLVAQRRGSDKHPDVVAVDVLHTVLIVLELLAVAELLEVLLIALCVLLVELRLEQEAVSEVVGRCAVAELLIEVIGEEYFVGLEIPLENDVVGHLRDGTVSVLADNDLVKQVVERTGHLTVLVVAYCGRDTRFVVAAAYLFEGLLDGLERSCYQDRNNDRARDNHQGYQNSSDYDTVACAQREEVSVLADGAAGDGIKSVLAAGVGDSGVHLLAVLGGVGHDIGYLVVAQTVDQRLERICGVFVEQVDLEVVNDGIIMICRAVRNDYCAVIERASVGRLVEIALCAAGAVELVVYEHRIGTNGLSDEHGRIASAAGRLWVSDIVKIKRALRVAGIRLEIVYAGVGLAGASAEYRAVGAYQHDGVDRSVAIGEVIEIVARLVGGLAGGHSVLHRVIGKDSVCLFVRGVDIRLEGVALVIRHFKYGLAEFLVAALVQHSVRENRVNNHRRDREQHCTYHQHGSDLHIYSPFPFCARRFN